MASSQAARGTNFTHAELRQVAISWVNVSGCPIVGNAQKNTSFWDRVADHYNKHRPTGCQLRGGRSLESKWSDVKHDVAKFAGAYSNVEDLRISGSSAEDTLIKARELYVQKHPKSKSFAFEDCWTLLKDCPKFAQAVDDMATKASSKGGRKRKGNQSLPEAEIIPGSPTEIVDHGTDQSTPGGDSNVGGNDISSNWQQRPIGNKSAKKLRNEECAFKISAIASRSMAATNERRTTILERQSTQSLFCQKAIDVDEEIRDDFRRNRMKEILRLRRQLDLEDAAEASEARSRQQRTPEPDRSQSWQEAGTSFRAHSPSVEAPPAAQDVAIEDLGQEFASQEAEAAHF